MAEMDSRQTGRSIREMRAQLGRVGEWFEYFASLARTSQGTTLPVKGEMLNYLERVPLGVCAQITPWNHREYRFYCTPVLTEVFDERF